MKGKMHNASNLCQRCQKLEIMSLKAGFSIDLASLEERSQSCDLCRLMYKSMVHLAARRHETVNFVRSESGLSIESSGNRWGPMLSLCTTSGS